MANKQNPEQELNQFLLYTTPNGDVRVKVLFEAENVWVTKKII